MPERGSKTSTVPVVSANLEFFRQEPNDFLSRLVTTDETWLYHYDSETKQQLMEWRHSGSPRPQKIPSAKIHWKISRLDFFLLSSKGLHYQSGVLLIFAGAIGHFEGKTQREGHQRGLVLAQQCPAHRHLQPQRNWPTLVFSVLITGPILRIWPRRTTTCFLD